MQGRCLRSPLGATLARFSNTLLYTYQKKKKMSSLLGVITKEQEGESFFSFPLLIFGGQGFGNKKMS